MVMSLTYGYCQSTRPAAYEINTTDRFWFKKLPIPGNPNADLKLLKNIMDIVNLIIIFFTGVFTGAFGTLIGGASLITIPLFIVLGLPPHTAIGTDRFGIMGIGWAGLYKFHRKKMIDYRLGFTLAVPTFLGSILGANLVLTIPESTLRIIIILTNVLCLIYMVLNPGLGLKGKEHKTEGSKYWMGGALCFVIGVYGGFYGAMAATFIVYVLIMWYGQTLVQSAANVKVSSIFMTTSAAVVFAMNGAIDYPFGIALFVGSLCGSYMGAHYAERIGNLRIKRFFIFLLIIMIIKMAFSL